MSQEIPNESHRIVSRGTYGWKRQPGSSYPQAYSGHNIPIENKFFQEYLSEKNVKMTHPLASGYVFSSSYAPAGGITEADMIQKCNLRRGCHPQLPSRQNQTSYILDSHLDLKLCPYGQKENIQLIPEEEAQIAMESFAGTEEEEIPIEENISLGEDMPTEDIPDEDIPAEDMPTEISTEELETLAEELEVLTKDAEIKKDVDTIPKETSSNPITNKNTTGVNSEIDSSIWFAIGALIFLVFYFSSRK